MNAGLPFVTVWAERDSPRLRYVLDWLLVERLGLGYVLTHDKMEAAAAKHSIFYGWSEDGLSVHASSLLWETKKIAQQQFHAAAWMGLHAIFFAEESPCDIAFDLFAAIFFLLSRYEEYLPFTPDKHARYAAQQSTLYDVLERPVMDEWVEALRSSLEKTWDLAIPRKPFSYRASYDIDIAWSYKFKGWKRTLGAAAKDLLALNGQRIGQRLRVLRGAEADPYDAFVWMLAQHMEGEPRPLYFILAAARPSPFDKNISPKHPRMAAIIRGLAGSGQLGLHPSYYSDVKPERLLLEKKTLGEIAGMPVQISRQHFIKLRFPQTYRALISAGIEEDYSMGYSTHFGFRAGTSQSFLWYDLEQETTTSLRVHPFAFMDSTAHYDLALSAPEAFNRLRRIGADLQACGGRLITIMHNYSLGTDPEWKGWRREYERFLNDLQKTMGNQPQI